MPDTPSPKPPGALEADVIPEVTVAVEGLSAGPAEPGHSKTTPAQWIIIIMGTIGFLYFGRPVLLPVFLACLAAMGLKPLVRWMTLLHLPIHLAAAVVFALMATTLVVGFFQIGRPAVAWVDEAPQHVADLRARVQRLYPTAMRMGRAVAAVSDLGSSPGPDAKKAGSKGLIQAAPQTVEIKDQRGTASILNWTGTVLAGLGEVLVLAYLILASGDLFMHKLVRVMPTLKDKKRAIEISHEIQQNISNYLFSVTVINVCLGVVVAGGLFILGVPKPAMWGLSVALLNYVPYFGPVVGVCLLAALGLLTFDSLWQSLLPASWYLALHLLESNLVTPILLGRRFTLNPVAIFVSLMFWLWLWGVPGALLSVPILVLVKAVCDRFPRASYMSELIGR